MTNDAVRWQAIESLSVINALVCVEEDAFSKLVRHLGGTTLATPFCFTAGVRVCAAATTGEKEPDQCGGGRH